MQGVQYRSSWPLLFTVVTVSLGLIREDFERGDAVLVSGGTWDIEG